MLPYMHCTFHISKCQKKVYIIIVSILILLTFIAIFAWISVIYADNFYDGYENEDFVFFGIIIIIDIFPANRPRQASDQL